MHAASINETERNELVKDGFLVIREAVHQSLVERARKLILDGMPLSERRLLAPSTLATNPQVHGLFEESCLGDILREEIGRFPDVISCQIAVTPPYDRLFGTPRPHVDGSWSGSIPSQSEMIDPLRGRPRDPDPYFGIHDSKRGTNDGLLWQDPSHTVSLGSYTALVGVALNDQLVPGNGQFGVLRHMHEIVERSFRLQRDSGGVIGPEGEGWPRIKLGDDGRPFLNGLPQLVVDAMRDQVNSELREGNWPWPYLTPVLLQQGDAVIALHSCPHTATPNLGPRPRMNLYFRIRKWREGNPHENTRRLGHGVSDHLDRGYYGQYLDYPLSYDPWGTSTDKLCDHWSEWDKVKKSVPESAS